MQAKREVVVGAFGFTSGVVYVRCCIIRTYRILTKTEARRLECGVELRGVAAHLA